MLFSKLPKSDCLKALVFITKKHLNWCISKNGAAGKLVRAALPPRKPKVLALLALLRQTSLGSVVRLALVPASPISHKQYF